MYMKIGPNIEEMLKNKLLLLVYGATIKKIFKDNLKRMARHGKKCITDVLYYPHWNWLNLVLQHV